MFQTRDDLQNLLLKLIPSDPVAPNMPQTDDRPLAKPAPRSREGAEMVTLVPREAVNSKGKITGNLTGAPKMLKSEWEKAHLVISVQPIADAAATAEDILKRFVDLIAVAKLDDAAADFALAFCVSRFEAAIYNRDASPEARETYLQSRVDWALAIVAACPAVADKSRQLSATNANFFAGGSRPTPDVTGAKAGNAALTSLLTALDGLGVITDSTT